MRVCLKAQRGCNPIDLLSQGLNVELVDRQDAVVVWSAVIEENVGGRLRLRYAGTDGLPDAQSITWVFYLDPLLHLPGWAQEHSCTLRPPAGEGFIISKYLCYKYWKCPSN